MIIGVTGMFAAGKDSVAEYLVKKGFQHYSLSDEIRGEARRRRIALTRDNLISLGNKLREELGSNVLAEWAKLKVNQNKNQDVVITSIRNPEEVRTLRKEPNFVLIEVSANIKRRFKWIKMRNREEDPDTLAELMKKEKIEQSSDPTRQQLHKVISMAKINIKNDGSLEELYNKVDLLTSDLHQKYCEKRPTWDEYFMAIADTVAKRATCDRGRTAVVIVKDKRILATGYVGSAMGVPHCDEVGHQYKKMIHEDGRVSQHCVRTSHAEQNALALASRDGVRINGATIYSKLVPCYTCAKMLVNAGIKRIVCKKGYHGAQDTPLLLKQAGVKLEILDKTVESYANQ
jgi:dCMP deaminase